MAGDVSFDVVSDFDRRSLSTRSTRRAARSRRATTSRTPRRSSSWARTRHRAARRHGLPAPRRPATSSNSKAVRRELSLKIFDWGEIEPAGGNTVRQTIGLRRGLPEDIAKKITKLIRDDYPKVKSQIQGDAVRVSSKSKDDLQKVIARLREEVGGLPGSAPVPELPLSYT